VDVIDTDGLTKLFALFSYRSTHPHPEPEPPDPVLDAIEHALFDEPPARRGGAEPRPMTTHRRGRLLVLAEERMGIEVRRHPDRDELLSENCVWFRGVSTGDRDFEDVSLTLAMSKWLLIRRGIEATDARTVALAMRLWLWATGARTG
jgi:hypothetical protein